jgi:hypothetical protein
MLGILEFILLLEESRFLRSGSVWILYEPDFRRNYRFHLQGKNYISGVINAFCELIANAFLRPLNFSFADFSTLKMEAIDCSETIVLTVPTRRHTKEEIPHSHRRETSNLT